MVADLADACSKPIYLAVIEFKRHDISNTQVAQGNGLADEVVKWAAKKGTSLPHVCTVAVYFMFSNVLTPGTDVAFLQSRPTECDLTHWQKCTPGPDAC